RQRDRRSTLQTTRPAPFSETSSTTGAWRAALNIAAFALGIALTWMVAERLFFARRVMEVFSPKLEFLRAHDGEIDTVFIGSSRVYHHFVPDVFDAGMRVHGIDTHSFNLAYEALWPPESFYRLRELLGARLRLRWIFIELLPPNPRINAANV